MEWDRRSGRFPAALANDALARPKIHGRFRQTLVQQENCKLNLDLMEIVRSTHCNHHKHLKVPALIPIKQIWHCTIAVKNAGRRGVFDDKASVQFSTDQGGGKSRSGNGTAFEFLCYSALGETPITPFGWRAVGAHKKTVSF